MSSLFVALHINTVYTSARALPKELVASRYTSSPMCLISHQVRLKLRQPSRLWNPGPHLRNSATQVQRSKSLSFSWIHQGRGVQVGRCECSIHTFYFPQALHMVGNRWLRGWKFLSHFYYRSDLLIGNWFPMHNNKYRDIANWTLTRVVSTDRWLLVLCPRIGKCRTLPSLHATRNSDDREGKGTSGPSSRSHLVNASHHRFFFSVNFILTKRCIW